jgi:hypothetical protein
MSVEENTGGTFECNKSLIKRALLATTCLQQSAEGSQRKKGRMSGCKCQNVSSLEIQEKAGSNNSKQGFIQLLKLHWWSRF